MCGVEVGVVEWGVMLQSFHALLSLSLLDALILHHDDDIE